MPKKVIIQGRVNLNGFSSVLVDLPQGLGDQIMCFPIFASLKSEYPEIHLTALTLNKGSQALLMMNDTIDDVKAIPFTFSRFGLIRFFLKDFTGVYSYFRRSKFDCVIVVHHNILRALIYRIVPKKSIIYNMENIHKLEKDNNEDTCDNKHNGRWTQL